MPMLKFDCDTGDGPNWSNRALIIYFLVNGNNRKALNECKGNKELTAEMKKIIAKSKELKKKK